MCYTDLNDRASSFGVGTVKFKNIYYFKHRKGRSLLVTYNRREVTNRIFKPTLIPELNPYFQ